MSGYWSLELTEASRDALLAVVPPEFPVVVAHHVTLAYGVGEDHVLDDVHSCVVLGEIIDNGIQALVVSVNGRTVRPDLSRYHITWSKEEGKFDQQSNALVVRGWWPFKEPIPLEFTMVWHAREVV